METGRQGECKELIRKTSSGFGCAKSSVWWSLLALVAGVCVIHCFLISNLEGVKKGATVLVSCWYCSCWNEHIHSTLLLDYKQK